MKITSKIFLNPVILFALLLVPGLVGAASQCNHTFYGGVPRTSITYYTVYEGGVSGLEGIDCGETPIEVTLEGAEDRLICFEPNPGFEISNWASPIGDKKVCTDIRTEISPIINWTGDGEPYTVPFDYTPNSDIGSASPISCTGGLEYNTVCSVNPNYRDQYAVENCPLSNKYICPGHSQKLASYEQYPVNTFPEVVFKEVIPGEVTVYGNDVIRGENDQTTQMIVPHPTEGQKNVEIYWVSSNVTNCYCTYNGSKGDCGFGVSSRPNEPVYADGPFSNGGFSLNSDKTFTVECD